MKALIVMVALSAPYYGASPYAFEQADAVSRRIERQCEQRWQNPGKREFAHAEYIKRCVNDDLKQWQ